MLNTSGTKFYDSANALSNDSDKNSLCEPGQQSTSNNASHNNQPNDAIEYNDPLIEKFIEFYNNLSFNNIDTLEDMYADDISFVDPIHKMNSLTELKKYFKNLYSTVEEIRFDVKEVFSNGNTSTLFWTMHLRTSKLNNGKLTSLEGMTLLKHREHLIYYHRDYYDMGEMIYEHLPILGQIIHFIKRRMTS